ncbi:MAG: hypothetical protein UV24_C0019G0019 [Candidatus Nomurabacteria bacterium GW2011_GWA2_42_41]|nr:MAG: hypothetical protein UV24_C0019G0019 [Candidatus Nomurabacteria bacterium GW2011_GWA2_42_41]
MKKLLISVVAVTLIVPQVAMASWWNPFTWKIFSKSAEVRVEQSFDVSIENIKATTTATSTAKISQQKEIIKKQNTNPAVISAPKKIVEPTVKPTETISQVVTKQEEVKINKIVTLPNGAIAEVDERGDLVRWVKEVAVIANPVVPSTQVQSSSEIQINSVVVTPSVTSVSIEWKTNIPTISKVFLSDGSPSSKIFNSKSELSISHSVFIPSLVGGKNYSYEIEATKDVRFASENGSFLTKTPPPPTFSIEEVQSGDPSFIYLRINSSDGKFVFRALTLQIDNPTETGYMGGGDKIGDIQARTRGSSNGFQYRTCEAIKSSFLEYSKREYPYPCPDSYGYLSMSNPDWMGRPVALWIDPNMSFPVGTHVFYYKVEDTVTGKVFEYQK